MNASSQSFSFVFACPRCGLSLEAQGAGCLRCSCDSRTYACLEGIWRFLVPEKAAELERFIREYESVRRDEGWWDGDSAEYYKALPFLDLTGRFRRIWKIRARSCRTIEDDVIAPLSRAAGRPLRILDLGAGNCWFSNRLAQRGHAVAAVDLLVNRHDGLGARVWYGAAAGFLVCQATFDRLPFAGDQADVAIFNGAFHYSSAYDVTLAEAMRVLRSDGRVIIMDSPFYEEAASGKRGVDERESRFERRYGFRGDAVACEGYLTPRRLDELTANTRLQWRLVWPRSGPLSEWRRRLRQILLRREPARFPVIVGQIG